MIDSLIDASKIVGVFKGFTESNLEFHADLVLPYSNDFNNIPLRGQFVLIQLENENEAILGRITTVESDGKLSHGAGEEYNLRAVKEGRPIPEDIREQYVRYRVNVRVLGNLRLKNGSILFAPSHRRLPHVGSCVAFPSDDVLRHIVGGNKDGTRIGHFALGEYIYCGQNSDGKGMKDWMQIKNPEIPVNFSAKSLVSRRSFIFARAGFGKSNLNKFLFSKLYSEEHTTVKRDKKVPVGTIIFDRDGEYYWPDDKGRPGLCDVPSLKDEIVVFTQKDPPSEYYGSFVAGGVKLDIRRFKPADILSIALSSEKQDQQNVRKLKGMKISDWSELVDLIDRERNRASNEEVGRLIGIDDAARQDAEVNAAKSNMTNVVNMLHDSRSWFNDKLLKALSEGKLCIVDVSKLSGDQTLVLCGIILRMIFDNNQEFTKAHPKTIPTIAVLEEAQSVLKPNVPAAEPFISWVKEGRKYDLGALMITQQPGSIPGDILSQGDNWFIFHLLSSADLQNVKKANAHYSDDILGTLLNEPIVGQCVMWSSVEEMSYPISVRIDSFEDGLSVFDKDYNKGPIETYASSLREKQPEKGEVKYSEEEENIVVAENPRNTIVRRMIQNSKSDGEFNDQLIQGSVKWGQILGRLKKNALDLVNWPDKTWSHMVQDFLNEYIGSRDQCWITERADDSAPLMIKVLLDVSNWKSNQS